MASLFETILGHAEATPSKVALISDLDGLRTYGELMANAAGFAVAAGRELGLTPGTRACIWMANRPEWVEAWLGFSAGGVALVPTNPDWADPEVDFVLRHAECDAIVCDTTLVERALALQARVPHVRAVICVAGGQPVPHGAVPFAALLATAPPDPFAGLPDVSGVRVGTIMYTSGTTAGRPKAVAGRGMQSAPATYKDLFGLSDRDRGIGVTPLFHANGVAACRSGLQVGGSSMIMRRFSASRFWSYVDLYRPTFLLTLVAVVNMLRSLPPSPLERSHQLRLLIVLGGGPSAEAIETRYGAPVVDWYGMTEGGQGTVVLPGDERRPGSAGRLFPGSKMKIVRDDLSECGPGEVGEVVFPKDSIGFTGYLNDAEATVGATKGEYFLTGDLGYFDADGFFYFVDRTKDIVRRAGENISSLEVEEVLRGHPGVGEIAVVAVPDPVLGERVGAAIVTRPGAEPVSVESLRSFAQGRMAPFKVPDVIRLVDELPRTGNGKVEKFRLRALLAPETT